MKPFFSAHLKNCLVIALSLTKGSGVTSAPVYHQLDLNPGITSNFCVSTSSELTSRVKLMYMFCAGGVEFVLKIVWSASRLPSPSTLTLSLLSLSFANPVIETFSTFMCCVTFLLSLTLSAKPTETL